MDLATDFKTYQEKVTSSLVDVTRTAGQISNQDLSFHRSYSDKFSKSLSSRNAHLLRLTNKLLKAATKESTIKPPTLQDVDDVDDHWRNVVDIVDDLLEKADASLDEFTGVLKRYSPSPQDEVRSSAKITRSNKATTDFPKPVYQKPQLLFDTKPNNYDTNPFKPLLKTKPHALVPLDESIGQGKDGYSHPYAHEIEQYVYPQSVYEVSAPIPFSPPNESRAIFVDTEDGVHEMLKELKSAKEIAIDLEHNERRSYIGLVCLMQISIREKDWIVDTLKPWRENLQVLNEVFTDPNIVKVFHGSSMDMIWLQRDLGLYVVGLFDTYHACCALQFPGRGLKYLLQRFANFEAQKQYQTADWRVRPLPEELIDYARSDTHYLLYIYDNLKNMLIESSTPSEDLINQVLVRSKSEALQTYERPLYDKDTGTGQLGWYNLLMHRPVRFDNEQFGVFRAIHEWRDQKARALDEGVSFVMPNQALWTIAETMPTHLGALYSCCRPMPKLIAENAKELLEVIKKAKLEGRDGPSMYLIIEDHEKKYGTYSRRWRAPKKEAESTFSGLGATLQQLTQKGEIETKSASLQVDGNTEQPMILRNTVSQFWGSIQPDLELGIPMNSDATNDALHEVLPISRVSNFSLREVDEPQLSATTLPELPVQDVLNIGPTEQNNDVFVLKDLSRVNKRKAGEELDDPHFMANMNGNGFDVQSVAINNSDSHESSLTNEAQDVLQKQKKADRRAKKETQKAEADAKTAQPTVPFDYANAESLLHGPGSDSIRNGVVQGSAKAMNPFASALDTNTGAKRPRMGKELPGKSYTFKS